MGNQICRVCIRLRLSEYKSHANDEMVGRPRQASFGLFYSQTFNLRDLQCSRFEVRRGSLGDE